MSRFSLPLVSIGLALTLSGCVSSSNPADLIPVGLRTTFGAEDRHANPAKPMTAEQLLAKLRGESIPSAPSAPSAPAQKPAKELPFPPIPASWGGPPSDAPDGSAGMSAGQGAIQLPPASDAKPPLTELTVKFDGVAPEPRSEDGLRVQLAASRAAKLGGVSAVIRVGPAGVDKLASISLSMRRGEAIRALLPESMGKTADVGYAPNVEPGAARFELR